MLDKPIYIFGEVLFDCFADSEPVLGGAPFNVAWHLQGFGESPCLISAVGDDDFGKRIRDAMSQWGMVTEGLQTCKNRATGVVNITLDNGEPTYDIREQVAYDYIELSQSKINALQSNSYFYHGSLAVRHKVSRNTLQRIHRAKPFTYFIDVNLRSPWWSKDQVLQSINCAFCVKLNLDELKLLSGFSGDFLWAEDHPETDWVRIAKEFKVIHNIVNLVVTRGEYGASLLDAGGDILGVSTQPHAPLTDTVGAGDAFTSVMLLGFIRNWDLQIAMERAKDFANYIITQRGALCTDGSTYRDFRKLWSISDTADCEY